MPHLGDAKTLTMKKILLSALLAASVLTAQAGLFHFELEPGGLLGANERPTPVVTTATGGELEKNFPAEPGIYFDDTDNSLFINIAWGDSHGFTDLTGAYTQSHIHGPAGINESTGFLYPLTANTQGSFDGVIAQTITLSANAYSIQDQIDQLFAGEWYINIHSSAHGSGEIRGQLVPVPEPQTYAMIAALGLLGFAGYRRYRVRTA